MTDFSSFFTILSPPLLYLTLFFLGTFFGSFFYVIVLRADRDDVSWEKGRSFCESCGHFIKWFDNIPVLSYLVLKGHCRECKKKLSWSYFAVEILTGLLFIFAGYIAVNSQYFINWSPFIALPFSIFIISVFWLIFLFDVKYGIIPDELVILTLALAILRYVVLFFIEALTFNLLLKEGIAAMLVLLIFLALREIPYLLLKKKGIGWGDIKLAAPLVLLLGLPELLIGFFCAFIIGGIWGIILLLIKQTKLGNTIPFGPFLVMGSLIAIAWGQQIWLWYWQILL